METIEYTKVNLDYNANGELTKEDYVNLKNAISFIYIKDLIKKAWGVEIDHRHSETSERVKTITEQETSVKCSKIEDFSLMSYVYDKYELSKEGAIKSIQGLKNHMKNPSDCKKPMYNKGSIAFIHIKSDDELFNLELINFYRDIKFVVAFDKSCKLGVAIVESIIGDDNEKAYQKVCDCETNHTIYEPVHAR